MSSLTRSLLSLPQRKLDSWRRCLKPVAQTLSASRHAENEAREKRQSISRNVRPTARTVHKIPETFTHRASRWLEFFRAAQRADQLRVLRQSAILQQSFNPKISALHTNLAFSFRVALLAVTLTFSAAIASAKAADPADFAVEGLARYGTITVNAAGPYVEIGTYRIQVTTKLGWPIARLSDGTWLYKGYRVEDSEARGVLAVRFVQDRVSGMSLVTTAVATAMMTPTPGKISAGNGR